MMAIRNIIYNYSVNSLLRNFVTIFNFLSSDIRETGRFENQPKGTTSKGEY